MQTTEEKQALAERSFWLKVGRLIDPDAKLEGWSYYDSGSFREPRFTVTGHEAAAALLRLGDRIATLESQLKTQRAIVAAGDNLVFLQDRHVRGIGSTKALCLAKREREQACKAAELIDKETTDAH